jgi:predicted small lipoprotein YifL
MRILLTAIALAILLPLGACGKKGEPKPPAATETSPQTDADTKKQKK